MFTMSVSMVVRMSVFFFISSFIRAVAVSMIMSARMSRSVKWLVSSMENFNLNQIEDQTDQSDDEHGLTNGLDVLVRIVNESLDGLIYEVSGYDPDSEKRDNGSKNFGSVVTVRVFRGRISLRDLESNYRNTDTSDIRN